MKCAGILFCKLLLLCTTTAAAVPVVGIRNEADAPFTLFLGVPGARALQWVEPEIVLRRKTKTDVELKYAGEYYVVVRDDGKHDFHFDWIDLHGIVARSKKPLIRLFAEVETKTKSETYVVKRWVTHIERDRCGRRWRVSKLVRENRVKEIQYTIKRPIMKVVLDDGEEVDISSFKRGERE